MLTTVDFHMREGMSARVLKLQECVCLTITDSADLARETARVNFFLYDVDEAFVELIAATINAGQARAVDAGPVDLREALI
ncbi:MAG: hypothetical protein N2444_00160 [Methylocystis sp.]|nr:hypothetical protein [Methylocystis sp.]